MEGKAESIIEKLPDVSPEEKIPEMDCNAAQTSTDHLICKSAESTTSASVKSSKIHAKNHSKRIVLYMGTTQIFLGFFMFVFGVFVIIHKSTLSHVGGGIWGGTVAMATGVSGVLAAAEALCPFNAAAQRVAHTIFLALSLVSLAVSQLVVVIASTGLARDLNKIEEGGGKSVQEEIHSQKSVFLVSESQLSIFYNVGLIVASAFECLIATYSSYKSSRDLCPCFKRNEQDFYQENLNFSRSHAIVSNWLGKNSPTPTHAPMYVIAGPPSSLGGSKMSSNLGITPIYAISAPMMSPQVVGYPLIPAPLGPVPSPIIPPPRRDLTKVHKKYKIKCKPSSREPTPMRTVSKEAEISQEEVAKTYTGLDRAMAEEFIDICDSKNASLCSERTYSTSASRESSCNCSKKICRCPGAPGSSDAASHDYLIGKI